VGAGALIGPLPLGGLVAGLVAGTLYLAFAIAVVACAAGLARSVIGAGGLALVVLIALPILGQVTALEPWLPSSLVGAPTALAEGAPASDFARAAVVTVALTPALLAGAVRLLARRES
jgi:hypothetical protein